MNYIAIPMFFSLNIVHVIGEISSVFLFLRFSHFYNIHKFSMHLKEFLTNGIIIFQERIATR